MTFINNNNNNNNTISALAVLTIKIWGAVPQALTALLITHTRHTRSRA